MQHHPTQTRRRPAERAARKRLSGRMICDAVSWLRYDLLSHFTFQAFR